MKTNTAYVKHGLKKHRHYGRWNDMRHRCHNERHANFEDYGARGITVCEEWRHDPTDFCKWADETYVEGLELDRRDNNSGYSPENCRWVTRIENLRNRRLSKKSNLPVGVRPSGRRFQVQASIGKRRVYLGLYDTLEEAAEVFNFEGRLIQAASRIEGSLNGDTL